MTPGPELDALVAEKVMGEPYSGFVATCALPRECEQIYGDDERDVAERFRDHGYKKHLYPQGSVMPVSCRPYSTDISAAWEVVEKLESERVPKRVIEGDVLKQPLWLHQDVDGSFIAGFGSKDGRNDPVMSAAGFLVGSHAETAPHAICLAALKAVGYEV